MYRIQYFFIIFILAFIYSCGDETSVDKLNEIKTDASIFEDGVSTAIEYNDGVISEISLLDLKMMALNEQFEKGVDDEYPKLYEECLNEYQRVSAVIRKVTPAGVGGTDFKISAIEFLDSYGVILEYYTPESITETLGVISSQEAPFDEQYSYFNSYNSAYEDYASKHGALGEAQQVFAKKNDIHLIKDEVDWEEVYEETK